MNDPHINNEKSPLWPSAAWSAVCWVIVAIVFCLMLIQSGCGTTGGIAVADFLQSPANAKIINIAASAGANALMASTGDKVTPEMRDALREAATAGVSGIGNGAVWAIGEALRTKQSTPDAAKAVPLATVIASDSGAPSTVARPVALAVRNLTSAGAPPDAANEAVAVAMQSVAAQRDGSP